MAATHKKQLTTTVRPGSLLSNQDIIAIVTGDTDIGGRIASVNDLRFSTAAGLWLEWMPIAFSLSGGALTATFRIVRPTILSSEDLVTEIHYGGTPDGSAPGPASTLSLPGLVGAWDCETANPSDWSGNGNNGTGTNVAIGSGKTGSAFSGNGSSSQIDCGSGASLNITGSTITVQLWVNLTALNTVVFGNYEATLSGWGIYVASNGLVYARHDGVVADYTVSATGITTGAWRHLAYTYDGANIRIYLDGEINKTNPLTGSLVSSPINTFIGRYPASPILRTLGLLDDPRLYNQTRSPDEIAYHVAQVNSPGIWGPEIALATNFKRLLKRRSLGQELYNGSLICG